MKNETVDNLDYFLYVIVLLRIHNACVKIFPADIFFAVYDLAKEQYIIGMFDTIRASCRHHN